MGYHSIYCNFIPYSYVLEDPIAKRLSAPPRNINQGKDVYIPYDRPPVQVTSKELFLMPFISFNYLFSVTLVA